MTSSDPRPPRRPPRPAALTTSPRNQQPAHQRPPVAGPTASVLASTRRREIAYRASPAQPPHAPIAQPSAGKMRRPRLRPEPDRPPTSETAIAILCDREILRDHEGQGRRAPLAGVGYANVGGGWPPVIRTSFRERRRKHGVPRGPRRRPHHVILLEPAVRPRVCAAAGGWPYPGRPPPITCPVGGPDEFRVGPFSPRRRPSKRRPPCWLVHPVRAAGQHEQRRTRPR